jgi:oxygen-dependent protoporphyrinogen oxidase
MTHVVVVGGGIAGLAAADRLAVAGAEVTLLEGEDRLGGKVYTSAFAGRPLDMGAEALVTREPTAVDLCCELSLDQDLVAPASAPAFVWTRRGLRPLPADALARLPGRFDELLRSRLLSPLGALRCGWDMIVPSRAPAGDVPIGEIVRSRLGREVLEQIVDPLLGGIHAGRCGTLSTRAVAPQLIDALGTGKGLVRGLRAARSAAAGPAFATLRGGLGSLTEALAARAQEAGAGVRLGSPVAAVRMTSTGRVIATQRDGDALEAEACVLATPASTTAQLLTEPAPAAAAELREIAYAPATVVALAYPPEALAELPSGTGFVTAGDERLVRACSWSSAKWEHLHGDPMIVKAFVGRAGARAPAVSDGELATAVHRELAIALRLREPPVELRVQCFGDAIPQYLVGHLERVARAEAALPQPIAVAGAAYRGSGLAACVRSGRAAADQLLCQLGLTPEDVTDNPRIPA